MRLSRWKVGVIAAGVHLLSGSLARVQAQPLPEAPLGEIAPDPLPPLSEELEDIPYLLPDGSEAVVQDRVDPGPIDSERVDRAREQAADEGSGTTLAEPSVPRTPPPARAADSVDAPSDDGAASGSEDESSEDERRAPLAGFIDINGYYDTRDSTNLTLNLFAAMPLGFHYFSFMNFFSPIGASKVGDLQGFYSEQNLRWAPHEEVPLDATVQWVIQSGEENDVLRFGVRWRLSDSPGIKTLFEILHLEYSLNFHFLEFDFNDTDGYAFQLEHFYLWSIFPEVLDRRIYFLGFLDHNLRVGARDGLPGSRIVTEHQLGIRLVEGLHAVMELRYDEFLPARKFGLGFGIEYWVNFEAGS